MKTPEPIRLRQRNYYRRKAGIPLDAPLRTRAKIMNDQRPGSGNRGGKIWMHPADWKQLEELQLRAGGASRGTVLAELIREKHNDTATP